MKRFSSKILCNIEIAENLYSLVFSWHPDTPSPLPGQFITINISQSSVPLLRRPFAVSDFNRSDNTAEIIYLVVGEGTKLLSKKREGDTLDILGPLGNSFPLNNDNAEHILVAGGIGLGPVCFLAKHLISKTAETRFFIGARSSNLIPGKDFFNSLDTQISTDDGSKGFKGTVIQHIKSAVHFNKNKKQIFYGCGPYKMLKSMCEYTVQKDIECYVSMERIIACGTGACMGCSIEIRGPEKYARVCKDGPVFRGSDIVWK